MSPELEGSEHMTCVNKACDIKQLQEFRTTHYPVKALYGRAVPSSMLLLFHLQRALF